jgi:hypothetical protein
MTIHTLMTSQTLVITLPLQVFSSWKFVPQLIVKFWINRMIFFWYFWGRYESAGYEDGDGGRNGMRSGTEMDEFFLKLPKFPRCLFGKIFISFWGNLARNFYWSTFLDTFWIEITKHLQGQESWEKNILIGRDSVF